MQSGEGMIFSDCGYKGRARAASRRSTRCAARASWDSQRSQQGAQRTLTSIPDVAARTEQRGSK
eukprot:6251145-Pyramimonas_sp.AAC.1